MSQSDIFDGYVRSSAVYCKALFSIAEKFYAANVAVERAVIEANDSFDTDLRSIQNAFSEALAFCTRTQSSLREFRSYHESYPGEILKVDFDEQLAHLSDIESLLGTILGLFGEVDSHNSLQDQIWADDTFTRCFINLARVIAKAVEWQCVFAERANLDS